MKIAIACFQMIKLFDLVCTYFCVECIFFIMKLSSMYLSYIVWLIYLPTISRYSYFLNFDFRQIKSSYGKSRKHEQESYRGWVSIGARGSIAPTKFENCLLAPTKLGKLLIVALTKFITESYVSSLNSWQNFWTN